MEKKNAKVALIILLISIVVMVGLICNQSKEIKKEVTENKKNTSEIEFPAKKLPKYKANQELSKKLLPSFRITKDQFEGSYKYEHKLSPSYVNQNGVYCYFYTSEKNGTPYLQNFFFAIQYESNDWLFIKSYYLLIDGEKYYYQPIKIQKDNNSRIWEWSNERVGINTDIIAALRKAQKATIRFNGKQYTKDKAITNSQLKAIREVCDLFESLGGEVIE